MSAEPPATPEAEGGSQLLLIDKVDEVSVGMRVEAKDSYGKWYGV